MATLAIAALSLGPSFAHLLEAAPRLTRWPPELWRETTVFNGQFVWFAIVGAPLDLLAILMPAISAFLLRADRTAFRLAIAGCGFYTLSLAVWLAWVNPANTVLASWTPGPIPQDFASVQWRWETGHWAVAAAKFVGFLFLAGVAAASPAAPAGKTTRPPWRHEPDAARGRIRKAGSTH